MKSFNRVLKYLPPCILTVCLLLVYLLTLAPGLTWANDGADGGDLIAAAATGGVAHPTGYPVYLILARGFQLIPIGSLAYRTNLMSALATVLAAVLVYILVNLQSSWLSGLAAGFAFGLASLVWSQAVITEVYGLHSLFVALLLLVMSISATTTHQAWLDRLRGLIFGLAVGNHVTTVLLFPILLFSSISYRKATLDSNHRRYFRFGISDWQLDGRSLLRQLAWMVGTAFLVYATLPLRALSLPPVNWGNPVTLNGLSWLVSGRLYQGEFLSTLPPIGLRIQAGVSSLLAQFGLVGLVLGWMGLIVFFHPSRLMCNTIWTAFASTIFAIVYGTPDSYVYLIPAFLCFAIWIGIGLDGLMKAIAGRIKFGGLALGLVFMAYLALLTMNAWPQVNASQDHRAEQFGEDVLAQAPEHAIVFAQGDQAVFAMWYFQYALRERPDLAVIASDLLPFDWYFNTLRSTYPDLHMPVLLPWPESVIADNPQLPICYVGYDGHEEIQCSP
jgi:Protein of unknown function (DUF2723)